MSPSRKKRRHGEDIYIPLDLTVEILKKLPAKSLLRFQCVSKQWSSIISSRGDFIDSIVTRTMNQPLRDAHIIFHYASRKCFLAFSSTISPRNTDKESELVLQQHPQSVRGLVCYWSRYYRHRVVGIYNPTTRQSFYLPELKPKEKGTFFFGYDPIEDQYKVLFLATYMRDESCQVFTLGDPTAKQWRIIQGVGPHFLLEGEVCINGTIYYRQDAERIRIGCKNIKLMSFDVRLEKFYHVEAPKTLMEHHHSALIINYQGKLGFIYWEKGVEIWVMERQRWSKIFFREMDGFQEWARRGCYS